MCGIGVHTRMPDRHIAEAPDLWRCLTYLDCGSLGHAFHKFSWDSSDKLRSRDASYSGLMIGHLDSYLSLIALSCEMSIRSHLNTALNVDNDVLGFDVLCNREGLLKRALCIYDADEFFIVDCLALQG